MATLTGKTLGKYQVFERIGRGGMADVYRGRHVRLDREVAIKVLHSHLAEGDDFRARFEREAQAIAKLQHRHIVQVYDFDLEDDFIYMVMEFIGGGNLKLNLDQAHKQKQFLDLEFVQQILDQVGSGLDYAHDQGMLHRDVKPGNILMREDGRAVLADFGIARILSTTQFTATGSLIGTPAYMSPEQGQGAALSPASDLYSLGVIVYEMLTNNVPFEAETPLATIHQQVYDALPSMTAFRKDLPPALIEVVERVLQKNPEDRFENAGQFSAAFRAAIAETDVDEMADTVVIEEAQDPEVLKETVVMAEEAPAEAILMEDEPSIEDKPGVEVKPEAPPEVPEERISESTPSSRSLVDRLPPTVRRYWPLVLAGLALVALVVLGAAAGWFSGAGGDCGDIGQCISLSENAMRSGDMDDAVALLDAAIDQISVDQEPEFADLWCRRADALLALDRPDESIESFEICAAWTHGIPELEDLRMEAQRRIEEILGN
jgi:serine/threonine protein kinase